MAHDSLTNGHGGGHARLRKLLAHHEQRVAEQQKMVDAIRLTLSMLEGDAVTTKAARVADVLADAVQLDTTRRGGRPRAGRHGEKLAGRARIHALISAYQAGDVVPKPPGRGAGGIGALVGAGYLVKDAAGQYVRTDKPHFVHEYHARQAAIGAPVRPRGAQSAADNLARREKTATFLAAFGTREIINPTQAKRYAGPLSVLAINGYIRRTAKGWQRTAKPFVVAREPESTT